MANDTEASAAGGSESRGHQALHVHEVLLAGPTWPGKRRTWSVPIERAGFWQSDNPTGPGSFHDYLAPATGSWIDDEAL